MFGFVLALLVRDTPSCVTYKELSNKTTKLTGY